MRNLLVVGLLAFVCGGGLGGVLGYQLADGKTESRRADALQTAAESAAAALAETRELATGEQRRAVAAAYRRGLAAQRADAVIADARPDPDRLQCEWSAAERVLIDRIYAAYGHGDPADSGGVSAEVRRAAGTGLAPSAVGAAGDSLGSRVQGATR